MSSTPAPDQVPKETQTAAVSALLPQALALHQAGDLAQAELLYRQILAHQPHHANVLYLLGLIRYRNDCAAEALSLFDQAIAVNPDYAVLYYDRAIVLRALNRDEDALASYDSAIALKHDYPKAHFNRGSLLEALERFDEALVSYDHARSLQPNLVEAHIKHGLLLKQLNRHQAAIVSFDRALAVTADLPEVQLRRAQCLMALERYEDAVPGLDYVVTVQPSWTEAHLELGNSLLALARHDQALQSFKAILALEPDHFAAHYNYGLALETLNHNEAALLHYDQAIALNSDYAPAHNNRGNVLQDLLRYDEALLSFDRALSVQADSLGALVNKGNLLVALNRCEEALPYYHKAQAISPDFVEANFNEGLCHLKLGNFHEGWPKHEWRLQHQKFNGASLSQRFQQPLWLGVENLAGKTILLHAEQGFGDTLQFCRFARELAGQGAEVVLEVQPALQTLMKGLQGVRQVVSKGSALPAFDYHCPLLSLPLALQTTLASIPADTAYIFSQPDKVALWHQCLGQKHSPRVGLTWSGNKIHKNDHNRSMPLTLMLTLALENWQIFSLQKELRPADQATLNEHPILQHFGDQLDDFSDTAALIEVMDLVISVDTSVAHLAAAMGKPVWLLLPFNADWRWLLERDDSPWYPTMHLFRQKSSGAWDEALLRVKVALAQHDFSKT